MKFLGIDLGWSSGASGLCCLELQENRLVLRDLTRRLEIGEILAWVDQWAPEPESAGIAVDAPTLIPNQTGMRLPDRLAHQHFGKYHAGCYPANRSLPFAARTIGFGLSLEDRGFAHGPALVPQKPGRFQIEVFPHPAQVHLFGLSRILKYKKGRLAERRVELERLRQLLLEYLPQREPALELQGLGCHEEPAPFGSLADLGGLALKAVEDQLDSLLCAYVAAHWWYWGLERNQVLGDRLEGYIVVPNRSGTGPQD